MECFVGLVCSVVWCVFCVFGRLSAQICVYCVAVFWLFGGVPCPLVWCGVLVLLWECFVGCFLGWVCLRGLWGLRVQMYRSPYPRVADQREAPVASGTSDLRSIP